MEIKHRDYLVYKHLTRLTETERLILEELVKEFDVSKNDVIRHGLNTIYEIHMESKK